MASIEPIKHRVVRTVAADGKPSTSRLPLARRDWRWRARYRDPSGRTRSRTFARKTDAERFLHDNGADLNRGEWVDPRLRRTAFRDWADEWWATTVRLAPTTRRSYSVLLSNHVLPWFADRPQASIDYLDVERFIAAKLAAGLSPKRVRAAVSVVSLVMRLIVRAGARKDNPAAGHVIGQRRRKLQPGDTLTMEDVARLAASTRPPYDLGVWLLVLLGLRPSELCGLRVRSVDFVRSQVTIRETLTPVHSFPGFNYQLAGGLPKTEAGERTLPIPRWLADALSAMLADRARRFGRPITGDDWLFEALSGGGRPLSSATLRTRVIRPALRAAGLPETWRTYDLRHAHASLLIDAGASPLDVAHRMGHTDATVTLRVYGHLFPGRQEELTEKLDALRIEAIRRSPGPPDVVDLEAWRNSSG